MKVIFHKLTSTTENGRPKKSRAPYKEMWAQQLTLSQQRKVEGLEITLDGSFIFEVRRCKEVLLIRKALKHYEVEFDGDLYTLEAGDFTKKDHAFVWFKAARSD